VLKANLFANDTVITYFLSLLAVLRKLLQLAVFSRLNVWTHGRNSSKHVKNIFEIWK